MLAEQNHHPRDNHIQFDEPTHVYTIDGNSDYKSVTTWIHSFFPHFDAESVISKMRSSKKWGPDNKYYSMSDEEIKDLWASDGKEAAELGTLMHLNIEKFYNGTAFSKEFRNTREYTLFNQYYKDNIHYIPYRTEWTVFTKKYRLAGSIDMVYYDPRYGKDPNRVVIADWKRSKEIKMSNGWEQGYGPLCDIDNCNYWHYCLQLNVYRIILENYYGKTVGEMFLVILHPNQDKYIKIDVPRIWKPISKMFEARKNERSFAD